MRSHRREAVEPRAARTRSFTRFATGSNVQSSYCSPEVRSANARRRRPSRQPHLKRPQVDRRLSARRVMRYAPPSLPGASHPALHPSRDALIQPADASKPFGGATSPKASSDASGTGVASPYDRRARMFLFAICGAANLIWRNAESRDEGGANSCFLRLPFGQTCVNTPLRDPVGESSGFKRRR